MEIGDNPGMRGHGVQACTAHSRLGRCATNRFHDTFAAERFTMPQTERFETHLTVAAGAMRHSGVIERFASGHGLKLLQIELPRGEHPCQPMLSWRAESTLPQSLSAATVMAQRLTAQGIRVLRTKIEASPFNAEVPQAESSRKAGRYFESHVKVLLRTLADETALYAIAMAHGAHLSRNARRVRSDGRAERFVTLRRGSCGYPAFARDTAMLEAALAPRVERVLEVEIEYVVYDSNLAIDAGWLPEEGA